MHTCMETICQERGFQLIYECNEAKVEREMPLRAMKKNKLLKGCRERVQARKGVSLQGKDNTNRHLARAMAKTWRCVAQVPGPSL